MTIAAGFRVAGGVLICADTLQSGTGAKLYGNKVFSVDTAYSKAVFTYTGNTYFAVAAIQKCQAEILSAKSTSSRDDIAAIVGGVLNSEYRRHVFRRPDRKLDDAYQIVAAIWSPHDGVELYVSWETSLSLCTTPYICIGAGQHLGDYLIGQMYRPNLNLSEAAIISLYTIARAKDHVEGCGGNTTFGIITTDGMLDEAPYLRPDLTKAIERELTEYNQATQNLLLSIMTEQDEVFKGSISNFVKSVASTRTVLGISEHGKNLYRQFTEMIKSPRVQ